MYRHAAIAAVMVTVAAPAVAQDYPPVPEPGQAFIAPLATEAMLLDGIEVDGRLVVVGEKGIVLISDDGGANWTQPQTGTRATLTGVHFHDRQTGWVVGHDALILRTGDGGATWDEVYSDPGDERPLFDVWFAGAERGFAIGAYGLLLQTSDGGTSWESLDLIPQPWPELDDPADPDEGEEFEFEDDQFYEGSFFNTLPLDGEQLLLMGLRGNLFRSNDGGQTWVALDSPVTVLLNDGIELPDGTILIGGMAGALLESRDGGNSFQLHQQTNRKAISALLAVNGDVIVVGEAGVRRTTVDALRAGGGS